MHDTDQTNPTWPLRLADLDVADQEDATADELTQTLDSLEDPEVCWGVLDELVNPDVADQDRIAAATAFKGAARRRRRQPTDRMLADFVSAVVAERAGDVLAAEAHLHVAAEADPEWGPLIDRAAWVRVPTGRREPGRSASGAPSKRPTGRSSGSSKRARAASVRSGAGTIPCWCGSGRKLKMCHAGAAQPIPLPDRGLVAGHEGGRQPHAPRR